MDRLVIAPCPDHDHKAGVWRVSSRLDDRKDSRRDLVGLDAPESLRWREKQLIGKY